MISFSYFSTYYSEGQECLSRLHKELRGDLHHKKDLKMMEEILFDCYKLKCQRLKRLKLPLNYCRKNPDMSIKCLKNS